MPTANSVKFDVDTILGNLGSCGLFHILLYALLLVPVMLFSMYDATYIFTTAQLDYRCRVPECDYPGTGAIYQTQWLCNAIPLSEHGKPMQCARFVPVEGSPGSAGICAPDIFNQSHTIACSDFVYDTNEVNLVNEFNITCPDNVWKLTSVGSVGYVADILILPLHGWISDRYGRRVLVIISLVSVCTIGLAKTYANSFATYIILKFVLSLLTTGSFTTLLIMILEWVVPNKRELASTLACVAYSVGQIVLGIVAAALPDFRIMLRSLYFPSFIVLAYIWFVPESLRWMHSKNQHERMRTTIERAARLNRVSISIDSIAALQSVELTSLQTKSSGQTIFTSNKLFGRLMICAFSTFTNGLIYTGLNVHSQSIAGSKYWNYIVVNSAEIPGNIIAYVVMLRLGRRMPLAVSLIVTAVLCILAILVPQFGSVYADQIRLVLCIVCKGSISVSYSIAMVYNSELFPTMLRQSYMNCCYAMACVGAMMAPQIRLLDIFMPTMTMFVFAGVSAIAGGLCILLPDTFAESLPDTIEQAENVGSR